MTRYIGWIGTQASYTQAVDAETEEPLFKENGEPFMVIDYVKETRRDVVMSRFAVRKIDPSDPPGFSKKYQWGPEVGTFIQPMTDSDAEKLLASPAGSVFQDFSDDPREERFMVNTESLVAHAEDEDPDVAEHPEWEPENPLEEIRPETDAERKQREYRESFRATSV